MQNHANLCNHVTGLVQKRAENVLRSQLALLKNVGLPGKLEYDSPDHCSKQCSIQGIQCMISDISGLPCVFHPVNLVL